jgi:hypothetical protein
MLTFLIKKHLCCITSPVINTIDAKCHHTSQITQIILTRHPITSALCELGLTAQSHPVKERKKKKKRLKKTSTVAFRSFLSLEGKPSQSQRRRPPQTTCLAAAETRRALLSRPMGCAGSTPATKETGGSSGKSPRSRSPSSSLCRAIRPVGIGVFLGGNFGFLGLGIFRPLAKA